MLTVSENKRAGVLRRSQRLMIINICTTSIPGANDVFRGGLERLSNFKAGTAVYVIHFSLTYTVVSLHSDPAPTSASVLKNNLGGNEIVWP